GRRDCRASHDRHDGDDHAEPTHHDRQHPVTNDHHRERQQERRGPELRGDAEVRADDVEDPGAAVLEGGQPDDRHRREHHDRDEHHEQDPSERAPPLPFAVVHETPSQTFWSLRAWCAPDGLITRTPDPQVWSTITPGRSTWVCANDGWSCRTARSATGMPTR